MTRFFIFSLCFLAVTVANARQVITGIASDKETSKPVENAEVKLIQIPDSIIIEESKTNTEGSFLFYKADTSKNYCIKFDHIIYKPVVANVPRKSAGMINSVGVVPLEPKMFNLKEVEISGFKVQVTELSDRTVYGVPEGIQKTSTDGVDVLRKIPSVQVDYLNEDIKVNGKSNIKIEVDGITRDKSYLKRLHPSQISKMEVITNPSGKYDAEIDAVINVVTNPAMRFGLKGMVYAGAFPISSESYLGLANASLDYGLEKISYYVAGNGIYQNVVMNSDMLRTSGNDISKQFTKQGFSGGMGSFNAGFIYDPDEKNDISLDISYNNTKTESNNKSWNYNTLSSNSSIFKTESNSVTKSGGLTTSLFYKHKFDKENKHGLEAEISYYNSLGNKTTSEFQNTYYNPVDTSEIFRNPWQNEFSDSKVQNITGQTNYNLPLDSLYFFNIGLSTNYNKYNTDNTSSVTQALDLDYTDLRLGAYAEISRTFQKGNLRVGSRFEGSSVSINSSDPHKYNSILPYMNALYRFNNDNSLKLTYSRRVIRPTSDQLNPFVSAIDSQTINKGNTNLKPAYRDNFQMTYNWNLTLKKTTFNISPELFYEYKSGLIQNIISRNETTGVFESTPTNISNGYETGGALSVNSQIGKILFNSNFRYSFYHINAFENQVAEQSRHGWNWNSFAMSPLPLNLQFMAFLNISGPVLDGQTETKTSAMYLLGIGKQFKNNSVLRLMAYNPFSKNFVNSTSTIRNSTFNQTQKMYLNKGAGVMLMYVYSFKVGKTIEREKRDTESQMQNSLLNLPINL